jgi:exopolysaccharide biosynthesis polyprenyl glycosylphosphotransferase
MGASDESNVIRKNPAARRRSVARLLRDENSGVASLETANKASPSPVVIQRRIQAARYARASATAIRVGVLMVADSLVVSVDCSIAQFLRNPSTPWKGLASLLVDLVPRGSLPRIEVLFGVLLGLSLLGNYGAGPLRRNTGRLYAGSSLGLLLVFWSTIWDGITVQSAIGFLLALAALGATLVLGRGIVDYFVHAVRAVPNSNSRAVVVASPKDWKQVRDASLGRNDSGLLTVGFVSSDADGSDDRLGDVSDLLRILDRYAIDTVIISEAIDDTALLDILSICDKTGCSALTGYHLRQLGGFVPRVVSRGVTPLVELYRPSLRAPQLAIKRVFDLVVSAALLFLLSPLFLVIALLVRFTSRGPVIFTQKRIGYAGRTFQMYKFRTMNEGAESLRSELAGSSLYADDRVFKIRNDPRVTPLGRILRKSSIDELPQLCNVLRGDMSLVGPRPPLPDEVEKYEEHHYSRFDMKPGITGPWQVGGRNEVTCFDEIIALETDYLTDWTIWKDVVLLLRTIPAVLSMRGAV